MNHFAVLTHKLPGLSLTDFLSKLVKTVGKSHLRHVIITKLRRRVIQFTMMGPAYGEKYASLIKVLGVDPERMVEDFSQPIRIKPTQFLSWGG